MRNHTAKWLSQRLRKQTVDLKLTSISGEQTYYEATAMVQQGDKELLPD